MRRFRRGAVVPLKKNVDDSLALKDARGNLLAKTIEKVLAEVMARCVAEGIERKLRPFSEEIALLRIAIEHEWECKNQ